MSDESFLFGFRRYVIGLENSHHSLNQPKATFVIILCYDWLLWLCCDHFGLGCKTLNQKSLHKHRGNRNGCRRRDKNEFRVFFLTELTLKYHIELYDVNYTPGWLSYDCFLVKPAQLNKSNYLNLIWNCKSDKATQLFLKKDFTELLTYRGVLPHLKDQADPLSHSFFHKAMPHCSRNWPLSVLYIK